MNNDEKGQKRGSNPCRTANCSEQNEDSSEICTEFAQNSIRPSDKRVRFPVTIRHRTSEAKIYAPAKNFAYYRLSYTVAGKRRMQTFATYPDARQAAERVVKEMAHGSQAAALSASQSRDALAALERLEATRQATGKRFSLLAAASEFSEAIIHLNGRTLSEAVEGFLTTVVSVKRKDVGEAVEEFIASREPKTRAKNGKRAQLSAGYVQQVSLWLRNFAKTFPATAVADLGKEHLNIFMAEYAKQSAKSRNHYRQTVKMFLLRKQIFEVRFGQIAREAFFAENIDDRLRFVLL